MIKACVLWMNDSRIRKNMKIARDGSAVKLGSVAETAVTAAVTDVVFHSSERISGQAPSFSIEGQLM